jgi:hypothetical protein
MLYFDVEAEGISSEVSSRRNIANIARGRCAYLHSVLYAIVRIAPLASGYTMKNLAQGAKT